MEGYRGNGLGVTIPPYQRRGSGAHHLLPLGMEEGWFRYYLIFDDWKATTSGKLPGFADVGRLTARGCNPSTAVDPGWSGRTMFWPPGTQEANGNQIRLGSYIYHLDQAGTCADEIPWSLDGGVANQNRWYCIEGHVRMNTPGSANGVLQAWVDGKQVLKRTDLRFRRSNERQTVKLRSMWLDVYFGGSTIPNTTNLSLRLDQLVVRDHGRVGCMSYFADTGGNVHAANIEALWRDRVIFGCAHNRYCPDTNLSRAAMLALIDRYIRPPATDQDFFTDDNGHWAEAVINRLAAAGVVKGCTPTTVCPDLPVTRGQIAAFLRRTFEVPAAETSPFQDIAGTTFAEDIAAIGASGITKGCADDRYCPGANTRRDQAASLFARAIAWAERNSP